MVATADSFRNLIPRIWVRSRTGWRDREPFLAREPPSTVARRSRQRSARPLFGDKTPFPFCVYTRRGATVSPLLSSSSRHTTAVAIAADAVAPPLPLRPAPQPRARQAISRISFATRMARRRSHLRGARGERPRAGQVDSRREEG
eukprot:9489361-Pyramimonas_sp.AAC.1